MTTLSRREFVHFLLGLAGVGAVTLNYRLGLDHLGHSRRGSSRASWVPWVGYKFVAD